MKNRNSSIGRRVIRGQEIIEIERDIFKQETEAVEDRIQLFRRVTGIPINVMEVIAAADGGVVTGELIEEIVLAKKNAAEYGILKPYLPGGAKSVYRMYGFIGISFHRGNRLMYQYAKSLCRTLTVPLLGDRI